MIWDWRKLNVAFLLINLFVAYWLVFGSCFNKFAELDGGEVALGKGWLPSKLSGSLYSYLKVLKSYRNPIPPRTI